MPSDDKDVEWMKVGGSVVGAVVGDLTGTAAGGTLLMAALAVTGPLAVPAVILGFLALPSLAIAGTVAGAITGYKSPASALLSVLGGLGAGVGASDLNPKA